MSNNPPHYGFRLPGPGCFPPNSQNVPYPHPPGNPGGPAPPGHTSRPTAPGYPSGGTTFENAFPSAAALSYNMNTPASQPPYMNSQAPPQYPGYHAFSSFPNSGVTDKHVQRTYNQGVQAGHTQFTQGPIWVKWHKGQVVPSNAVQGGKDVDNANIYVGRLYHNGDLLPAKFIPERNVAYVSYDGREFDYYECEVLCQGNVKWTESSNGNVPPGAIQVGQTSSREPLYIGRVKHKGSLCVGKVHPSHGVCYIPFGGKEKAHRKYEVLVA